MKYHLYCRVSHKSQNLASQIRTLKESYPEGELYQEKLSGISKTRPERDRMIASLEPGDCVVCIRMSRLSRSMTDLFNVVEEIAVKGANIRFIHENIDTTTSHGRLVFGVMASINNYHLELIRDSCSAGIRAAQAAGTRFGKPPTITKNQEELVRRLRSEKKTYSEIEEATKIKKGSIYLIMNPEKRKLYNNNHKIRLASQRNHRNRAMHPHAPSERAAAAETCGKN